MDAELAPRLEESVEETDEVEAVLGLRGRGRRSASRLEWVAAVTSSRAAKGATG